MGQWYLELDVLLEEKLLCLGRKYEIRCTLTQLSGVSMHMFSCDT